jgi:hypothetical protein
MESFRVLSIELTYSCGTAAVAFLRPLAGQDENAIRGTGLPAALALVGRLLVPSGIALGAAALPDLAIADFDRILVALQRDLYGDTLECRSSCSECDEAFEFSLPLELLAARDSDCPAQRVTERRGWFSTDGGTVFRLPTVSEVLHKASSETLMKICADEGSVFGSVEEADAAFAAAGPLACETIDSACPHCEAEQATGLDLVDYLTEMLARERPFLVHETHCIARAYGWGLKEIHSLPRDDRRAFVRLIGQKKAVRERTGRRFA